MIEGLWILQIQPPPAASGGVVVLVDGKVFGGDSGFAWAGTYTLNDRLLKGRVHVSKFDPQFTSVFGALEDYEMHITGTVEGDSITGTAMVANQPQYSLAIKLTKRAPL